jgi:vacuolar protein sorting-associated protein 41
MDETGDVIGTAGVDGQVLVHTLSTSESIGHNFKRPMRTIALEPGYATKASKAYVCGGMAGEVVLQSQGWLGNFGMGLVGGRSSLVINRSEENDGPIWVTRWRGDRIAWANDTGIKLYDSVSQMRFAHVDRPPESPRADLFKCTLYWQDDVTLLAGWADVVTIIRVRPRPGSISSSMGTLGVGHGNLPPLIAEVQAVLKVDCMVAGVVPHPLPVSEQEKDQDSKSIIASSSSRNTLASKTHTPTPMSCFLVLSYIPPDTTFENEAITDRAQQKRKAANPPELLLVSRSGNELGGDVLPMKGYEVFGCNDYVLAEVDRPLTVSERVRAPQVGGLGTSGGVGAAEGRFYLVLSPRGVVIVRARDKRDHVDWLVEKCRYEEALKEIETMEQAGWTGFDRDGVGRKYLDWLFDCEEWEAAAKACPTILGNNAKAWEEWIFLFAQKLQLQVS